MIAPTRLLRNGARMPRLGLGTWPMSDAEAEVAVAQAAGAGYRLFDTAYNYGNERGVGSGLRASGIPREELFVVSKFNGEWHGFAEAQAAFHESAARLRVEYLDLFLIHWPLPRQGRYVQAFLGLVKLLEDGYVRAIGLSNFKPAHIERILAESNVRPDVNQIQLNPSLSRSATRAFDAHYGIVTQAWSPLGRGRDLLTDPIVTGLAERYQKSPAQIILRWHIELDVIPVPRSVNPDRQKANLDVFTFQLTPADLTALATLDRGEQAAVDSDATGH